MSVRSKKKEFVLYVNLYTRSFLLDRSRLEALQRLLVKAAPMWSRHVRILYDEVKKLWSAPIDMKLVGALFEALDREARRPPSEFKRQLYRRFGKPRYERLIKSFQLDGANKDLVGIVHVDEYPFAPVLAEWHWSNEVSFQLCTEVVEGKPAQEWARALMADAVVSLRADYGYSCMVDEYDEKNLSRAGGGLQAVGLDISKALPGLYWLNFFGPAHRDLIGRERLLNAPAAAVRELDDAGVLLELHPEPTAWNTAAYRDAERRVLEHLGPQYFFSKDDPERTTAAPDFGLPPRPA